MAPTPSSILQWRRQQRHRRRAAFVDRLREARQPAFDTAQALWAGFIVNEDATSIASRRSPWSVLSYRSVASALSVGSFLSAGSAFSVGSAGSIASAASAGSILSIASTGSILSIGASGGFLTCCGGPRAAAHDEGEGAEPVDATVRRLSGVLALAAVAAAFAPSGRGG